MLTHRLPFSPSLKPASAVLAGIHSLITDEGHVPCRIELTLSDSELICLYACQTMLIIIIIVSAAWLLAFTGHVASPSPTVLTKYMLLSSQYSYTW